MNKAVAIIMLVISILGSSEVFGYGDYYKGSKRGWYWFEQPEAVLNKEGKKTQETEVKTATEELQQFSQELDEAKAAMIIRPNIENTAKFIEYQNEMFRKADVVTENWQDAMLIYPNLNIARDIPISHAGAKIRSRAEAESNKQLLNAFSKKFTLLFFYKGSCIYCSHFAEVLEIFAKRYGFKVSSVTIDGKQISKFPGSRREDLVSKFNVEYFPSVYAYSDSLGVVVPISSEFLAIDELENHAVYVASKLKERL